MLLPFLKHLVSNTEYQLIKSIKSVYFMLATSNIDLIDGLMLKLFAFVDICALHSNLNLTKNSKIFP